MKAKKFLLDIHFNVPNVCKPGPWSGDLTARAITGSGDNSRDLTRRTIKTEFSSSKMTSVEREVRTFLVH